MWTSRLFWLIPTFVSSLALASADPATELKSLDFFRDGRGMSLSPGLLDHLEDFRARIQGTRLDETVLQTLTKRWGLQSLNGELIGLKNVPYRGLSVGVVGCVACHSGKAAGQHIVGIGNKNIDPGQIGIDGVKIESWYRDFKRFTGRATPEHREIEERSLILMRKLADPRLSAQTQGLVPVSLVGSWFYEMAGRPLPEHGFKGATKVPSWFGFGEKLKVGQFADGIGQGHPPGWIIGVEITSGQTAENVRAYQHEIEQAAQLISALTPPRYPFGYDPARAERGRVTFEKTCAKCHGTYERDLDGRPIYREPRMVEWEKVGTDTDRLDYVDDSFLEVVRASPLADLIQLSPYAGKRMWVAPRLHAIWARFPYLHNASVPTLRDLLEPASKRPRFFSLKNAGEKSRFDPKNMGLTRTSRDRASATRNLLGGRNRDIYDTRLPGQSNQGHEKGTTLTAPEKDDLIEYLKTL